LKNTGINQEQKKNFLYSGQNVNSGNRWNMEAVFRAECLRIFPVNSNQLSALFRWETAGIHQKNLEIFRPEYCFHVPAISGDLLNLSGKIRLFSEAEIIDLDILFFFRDISSIPISLEKLPDNLDSLSDFHLLNISTLAILTNAYEDMNPYYNSYRDTLINLKDNYSFIENHIYILLKTICNYWNFLTCLNDLSIEIKQALTNRISALFDCFLQLNCTNLLINTNETGIFYFQEVLDNMKENFSFLQPILHQSDVKTYLNNHFLHASSYIHDILLNWIAIRMINITKTDCEDTEDLFPLKIYQESTKVCLHASINSINLIQNSDEFIDNRIIFTSNSNEPELLIYMINNTKKDLIMLICGIILSICGFILTYFLKNLLPIILNKEEEKF
jgi:hypothetical protein